MEQAMYDAFSSDYDRFVNWQNRLSAELPFIIEHLQLANARIVLDAATGTGMHVIALAQLGYQAKGADISSGMIQKARANASASAVNVQFEVAGFGTLVHTFGAHSFDALLCLGNSLPHLLSTSELAASLADFALCLKFGGMLILQNRNFEAILHHHDRWMDPQYHSEATTEWIFLRFYDFDPDGLLTFNMITLKREGGGNWSQKVVASRLRPLLQNELVSALSKAGFEGITSYGNLGGDAFDPEASSNLVVIARIPN